MFLIFLSFPFFLVVITFDMLPLNLDFRPLTTPELSHFGQSLLRVSLHASNPFDQITLYCYFSVYAVK